MSPERGTQRPGVAEARPETTSPVRCAHFGPCGGCSLLDREYGEELALKQAAFLRAAGARLELDGVAVSGPRPAAAPLFYRTSLKIPFGLRRGRAVAGFYRPGSHRVVALEECAVQDPRLVQLLAAVLELANEQRVSVYDEASHRGLLRHFVARVGTGTGECLAGLVVRYGRDRAAQRLADALLERAAPLGLVGVAESVNAERGSRVLGPELRTLCGRETLREVHDGLTLETSLASFSQVNPAQASVLYAEVERLLRLPHGALAADLYAGHGPVALRLARSGARVLALEANGAAVAEGRRAAEANGLADRVELRAVDAERGLREARAAGVVPHAVVADPPRRGLSPGLVDLLRELAVARLVLVSCWPDALLRDLASLRDAYALREVCTVDLFPRTPHLEAVALLEGR